MESDIFGYLELIFKIPIHIQNGTETTPAAKSCNPTQRLPRHGKIHNRKGTRFSPHFFFLKVLTFIHPFLYRDFTYQSFIPFTYPTTSRSSSSPSTSQPHPNRPHHTSPPNSKRRSLPCLTCASAGSIRPNR